MQLLVDSMLSLVDDWSKVYALCPASMPAAKVSELRNRSKIFRSVLDDHRVNTFWLTVCRSTNTFLEPVSCLFQPISHAVPFPDFAKICVLLSGFGDGVRQGVKVATELAGGAYVPHFAVLKCASTFTCGMRLPWSCSSLARLSWTCRGAPASSPSCN